MDPGGPPPGQGSVEEMQVKEPEWEQGMELTPETNDTRLYPSIV